MHRCRKWTGKGKKSLKTLGPRYQTVSPRALNPHQMWDLYKVLTFTAHLQVTYDYTKEMWADEQVAPQGRGSVIGGDNFTKHPGLTFPRGGDGQDQLWRQVYLKFTLWCTWIPTLKLLYLTSSLLTTSLPRTFVNYNNKRSELYNSLWVHAKRSSRLQWRLHNEMISFI